MSVRVCACSACEPCTNPLPAHAAFSGPGHAGDAATCPWECAAGYRRSGGGCAPCSTAACPVGQYRGKCSAEADGWGTLSINTYVYTYI